MLKVENLDIMLSGLTAEEKMAPAKVVVKANGTAIAHGTCSFTNDGMNIIGSVAAGGAAPAGVELANPAALVLEASRDVARKLAVKKGATEVKTHLPLKDARVSNVKLDGTAVAADKMDENGVITLVPAAAEDAEMELTLTVTASAPFVFAKNTLVCGAPKLAIDEGPVHFSMIVEAEHHHCSTHSKTRCTVRGRKPWKNTGEDGPLHVKDLAAAVTPSP